MSEESNQVQPTTIVSIQVQDVKRVKAVALSPSSAGLTIIGGNNRQGKTSILDAICWGLGGKRKEPSDPHRDGAVSDPFIDIELSNGVRIQRKGPKSNLQVTDTKGARGNQTLLDSLVSEIALDLPKFMNASATEKAKVLLDILGIGPELKKMEALEDKLYQDRTFIGQNADAKKKYAEELEEYPSAPSEKLSVSGLIEKHGEVLARNAENKRSRDSLDQLKTERSIAGDLVASLAQQLSAAETNLGHIRYECDTAEKSVAQLNDESTEEIQAQMVNHEATNAQVSANLLKETATDQAKQLKADYDQATSKIDEVRAQRKALLDSAPLPLDGLAVEKGELCYKGAKWDGMSGADHLMVSTAIARAIKPECGFVLMDELEKMDMVTLTEFAAWLKKESLQVIATRVSTGEECTLIIEDGLPEGMNYSDVIHVDNKPEGDDTAW